MTLKFIKRFYLVIIIILFISCDNILDLNNIKLEISNSTHTKLSNISIEGIEYGELRPQKSKVFTITRNINNKFNIISYIDSNLGEISKIEKSISYDYFTKYLYYDIECPEGAIEIVNNSGNELGQDYIEGTFTYGEYNIVIKRFDPIGLGFIYDKGFDYTISYSKYLSTKDEFGKKETETITETTSPSNNIANI